ncbi:hypothetical protein Hypma_012136 [Hypsizygus marmoreus]|uniref:F-box domain-containing protein n=1 Tax=Hypsizygus marmoreus TaxID=39966 RepID=A0A369JJI0_HYPMA|nr:hypothetical protein Hypma_012136 [Hypsizygus marmoreus]
MSIETLPSTTEDLILSGLEPRDLVRYSKVSRTTHSTTFSYVWHAFNINKHLSQYFPPSKVDDFRVLQCSTGTLVSGASALEFFLRRPSDTLTLDLYVDHVFALKVGQWLLSVGYKFVRRTVQPQEFKQAYIYSTSPSAIPCHEVAVGINTIFDFRHPESHAIVHLVSAASSPLHVILNFHLTCVMNIISHDVAVSLYPSATFATQPKSLLINYAGTLLGQQPERYSDMLKYEKAGWTMISRIMWPDFNNSVRRICDRFCWTIPLRPVDKIGFTVLDGFSVEGNTWRLYMGGFSGNTMVFSPVVHYRLRYNYISAEKKAIDDGLKKVNLISKSHKYADRIYLYAVDDLYGHL